MKKKVKVFKRSILSLLLCLSLVVSPLAGTGLVVSAEETTEKTSGEETTAKDSAAEATPAPEEEATQAPAVEAAREVEGTFYSQDFTGITSVGDISITEGETSIVSFPTDGGDGYGTYLKFVNSQGGQRGVTVPFSGVDVTQQEKYIVIFDALIKTSSAGPAGITVTGIDYKHGIDGNNAISANGYAGSGYLLDVVSDGPSSTTYTINGGNSVTLNGSKWYNYKLFVDTTLGMVSTTITAVGETKPVADKVVTKYDGKGYVAGLHLVGNRYSPTIQIDNIVVRAVNEEEDEFGETTAATVSFDINGHGDPVAEKEAMVGGTVEEPAAPKADGWVFRGWYKEAECTNVWNFVTDTVPEEGVTLYAKWSSDPVLDTADALYAQTFSNIDDISKVYKSTNAQARVKIATDDIHGYYLTQINTSGDTGERSGAMDFSGLDVSKTDYYSIEFTAVLTPDTNASQNVALVIKDGALTYGKDNNGKENVNYDITGGYLFKLACSGSGSTTYTVNDETGKTVIIPSGKWCDYKLVVDKKAKTVTATITKAADGSAVTTEDITASFTGAGEATGLHARVARNSGVFSVDNIVVKAAAAPPTISGDESITKETGKTVEKTYTVTGVEGENFTWAVKAEAEGGSTAGITISDGKLSVADNAAAGKYIITATSSTNTDRVATFEVEIKSPAEELAAPEITGAKTVTKETGKTVEKTYTVTGVDGETFTWAVKAEAEGGSTEGITIGSDGKLSVADTAAVGKYIITATSGTNAERVAAFEVEIKLSAGNGTAAKVFINEDFDSYSEGTIIAATVSAGPQPVEWGSNLIFKAGDKNDMTAAIKAADEGKYVDITRTTVSGSMTGFRGIRMLFKYTDTPDIAALKNSGLLLKLSVDISSDLDFNVVSSKDIDAWNVGGEDKVWQNAEYSGFTVPAMSEKRHMQMIIDAANSKRYLIISDMDGNVISSSVSDYNEEDGTGFSGLTFLRAVTKATVDNLRVDQTAVTTVIVKNGDEALEGATVKIGDCVMKTDAEGKALLAVPAGTYTAEASKAGFKAEADSSKEITVGSEAQTIELKLSPASYTAEPTTVTVADGQSFITASKEDAPAQSAAFTVSVTDQMGAAMERGAYEIAWSILPEGKTVADPNVTIDADGKVSVTKDFHTDDKVAVFEVTATATANGTSATGKATIFVANSNVVYYEPIEWEIPASKRNIEQNLGSVVQIPAIANVILDIEYHSAPFDQNGDKVEQNAQSTLALANDKGRVAGVQYQRLVDKNSYAIYAWAGQGTMNSNLNQSGDLGTYAKGVKLADSQKTGHSLKVTFLFDQEKETVKVSDGTTVTEELPLTAEFATLTKLQYGLYRSNNATTVHSILVEEAEPELPAPVITGAESITKETGKTVEENYTVKGAEGETFTWAVKAEAEGGSTAGITISDGKLSVADTAAAGLYTITATSSTDTARAAEFEVEIINAASADAKNFLVLNATGDTTAIDSSQIISKATSKFITGYQITLADASGKLLSQEIVSTLPASVDTKGAAKVEIAPVYVTNIANVEHALLHLGGNGNDSCNIELPEAGTYDFKVTSNTTIRTDVYVNDQMLVNNLLQEGSWLKFMAVKDIVLADKVAKIRTEDYGSGDASNQNLTVQIVKSPEVVDRVRKVYVLGDSLVCYYYNDGTGDSKTGWGQVLQNYITGAEVVDLANSGSTAHSLEATAFSQIRDSAKAGDILLLESAYNDATTTKEGYFHNSDLDNYMAVALRKMVEGAKAKGVEVILVSPNASLKPYRATPGWTTKMEAVVEDLNNKQAGTVGYIDLAQLSFDFLSETYGADDAGAREAMKADYVVSDDLHTKRNGAHKYASLVAGALKETHPDIVDTEYCYTFTDINGQTIFCVAGDIPADRVVTLTYEMNGHGKQYPATKVVKGEKLKAMAPSEADYAFKGWYKDAGFTQKWDFDADVVGNTDFTLYAKWEERKGVFFKQDFEEAGNAADVGASLNDAQISIASGTRGKYLLVDWTKEKHNGGRGSRIDFDVDVKDKDSYVVEFDALITPGGDQKDHLAVMGTDFKYISNNSNYGAESGYLLMLDNDPKGNDYIINDGLAPKVDKVTISPNTWYHYKLYVDKKAGVNGLVSITITKEGETKSVADKVVSAYKGDGNVQGIYMMVGRYYGNQAIDNILVREVAADDEFGEIPSEESLKDAEFTAQLNTVITQSADGAPVHKEISVKAKGSLGGDLTDKVSVAWSIVGLEKEDGYISLTQALGTGLGTEGAKADTAAYTGTTAYFNVRNGVSNYQGYVQAVVTYGEDSVTIITPFAVIGAGVSNENQLAPATGYPVSMDDYADSLVGYSGTSKDINSKDIILNNWSIYGSNGARTLKLVKDADGTKSLEFASNGGSGSTVAVYQWTDQTSQYVIDFTAKFTNGMAFGVYANTPNNTGNNPEWSASYAGGVLTFGSDSISGLNANEWYRFVISADPSSIQKASIAVYKGETKVGEIEDVDMANNGSAQKYFCFYGTWPMYLNSFKAYKPVTATLAVKSDADTVKVPEAGQPDSTVALSAAVTSTEGIKMTGAVQWSLEEEYANVEIESTGAQTATLKISEGASGTVVVIASKDGKRAEKEINLTTSSNVVAFAKSTSSITIPFAGEQAVTAAFTAETRDKDGKPIDGGAITYALLAKDGVTETTVKGVTFENGVLTVEPGASPAVIYIKAANAEGLSTKVKVNIHGLSFAFGSQDAEEGYTQVTDTLYTDKLGYGFADISGLTVNTNNVTGQKAFRFKAKVPNGNYVVKVDTTATTMTSEVVESVSASTGIEKTGGSFSVAVCDGVLDLTFPAASNVKSIEISQAAAKTKLAKPMIYAIGDSTANNTANGARSWGNCVSDGLVQVPDVFSGFANYGWGGKNSVSYYNPGRVEAVLLAICPGDYVTVNMGINSGDGEAAAYETLMRDYYVKGILQRGGIPIILTATPDGPVNERVDINYDKTTGKFTNDRGNGARNDTLRKIAKELDVKLIELGQWGQDWMNTLTEDDLKAYNAAYMTNYKTVLEMVQSWYVDHNHYKEYLGKQIAWYLFTELATMAGGEGPERPALPKPEGGSIIEDFETTTDWQLDGSLAGKFSVVSDGKGGHYLLGNGAEVGTGSAYAKKVFAELPDMETAEVSVDWIAPSAELKTQDKQAYFALQLWSGESELVSLYVSDLRGNAAADVYYSATGIGDKQKTGVTFKQGQTLKVKFALNFAGHTLDIYLDDAKVASGISFDALATKVDTFAIATLDDTAAKKKYPNFAIDNFSLTYMNSKGPQDLSKLVKSVKPMAEMDHGKVSNMTEFVHPTKATVVLGDGTEMAMDINAATWNVDKPVNFAELGTYTWTADLVMPEGYNNPNKVKVSYVMNYLADFLKTDINSLDPISVVTLTKAEYEAGYSHPETVTAKLVSGKKAAIEIDQSTWTCEPAFDPAVRGIYVWTAQLKDNGTNGNPRNLKVSYTMHYQADWVSTHDFEDDFLFGYTGWDVWGKDIDNWSGTGGFGFEIKKDGDNPYLYATQADSGKNRGSRLNLPTDIVRGATMEFDFMPAVVNGGSVDLLFVAPAYKQNYLSLLVNANGKVTYHTTEDLDGSGGHPKNNDFDGVISKDSPVATGVGAIGKWMHIKVDFDYLAHKASLTVTSKENPEETYTVSDIPIDNRANGLSIMVVRKLSGCSRAEVAFDNVIVDYDKFGATDIVKLAQPQDVNVAESEFDKFVLPTEMKATLGDNSTVMVPVGEWKSTPEFKRGNPGTYVWTAEIENEKLGLSNHFGLSLSFTMTYTMLPFPVYVFNPNTLELKFGEAWSSEQLPTEVDAKMSSGASGKVKVGDWTEIREFSAEKEGIYVYGANVVAVDGEYDVVQDKISPNENPDATIIGEGEKEKYVYNVYYRISYFKDEVDNYNGYERTMENLDRGVYAVAVDGGVFVSWRLLATEYGTDISFDVYRNYEKVTTVTDKTNLVDAAGKAGDVYTIVKTQGGNTYEGVEATASDRNYMSIPVQKPDPQPDKNGDLSAYTLNDMGVADVNGDGKYEIIVKWIPDNGFDSGDAKAPSSPTIFDLYKLDGTPLWRLNLGLELPSGAHFNQFMLYDLDEDGKAELFIKTSDGTTSYKPNAEGKFDMEDESTRVAIIGDTTVTPGTNIESWGHASAKSNEYVTVFDGETGKVIDTRKYDNPTVDINIWSPKPDGGNRSARYNIAIAYLPREEGSTETIPAVLFNRGYYDRTTVAAYTLRDGKIELEWNFVRETGDSEAGKGNHNVSTGDIDKDGFDEIILGAIAIDHDGSVLWVKDGKEGQDFAAHADAIHLAAMNPNSNDLYVFTPNEEKEHATMNAAVVNARTGARISGSWFTIKDVGRAIAANITPKPGYEYWSASTGSGIYAFDGSTIANTIPVPMNWRMYWDGDLLSELGDGAGNDDDWLITKYNWEDNTLDTIAALEGTKTNNWSKKTPGLTADLFGDWREEVALRNDDDTEIRIYMTTEETDYMIYTLMHDPVYRNAVANQNTSYNQPPHVGFYLGEDNKDTVLAMGLPTANIKYGTPKEEKVTIAEAQDVIPEPTEEVKKNLSDKGIVCNTAEDVKTYLRSNVISAIQSAANIIIPDQSILVQEIEIKVKTIRDGIEGDWETVTPENFPKEGVKVVLPYPDGTNREEYNFTVSHLITISCNKLKAGDVVNETVTKTEDGLEMIIMSASPFAIGWYKIGDEPVITPPSPQPGQDDQDDEDDQGEQNVPVNPDVPANPENPDGGDEPVVNTSDDKVSVPAKTGDHMGSILWLCIVLIALAAAGIAVTVFVRYRKKK